MGEDWPARARDLPYFFLSYRRSEYQPGDGSDPDMWVKKFYQDLCNDLHQLTSVRTPGFMDVQTPVGHDWPDELVEALCGCKVFVPLITPGYFESDWCGREWAAFTQRMLMHASEGKAPPAIFPVLWAPFKRYALPAAVGSMQLIPPGFPKAYEEEGLFGLIKLKRYSVAYVKSVLRMAQAIQQIGDEANLASCPTFVMDTLHSAFADHKSHSGTHQIRLTVAAYPATSKGTRRGRVPARARNNYYYGHTMREWMPYRSSDDATLITRYAESVIRELGHHALLDPLDDRAVASQPSPTVMLVDPWAPGVPEIADTLRAVDTDPVHVLVPWNQDDDETNRRTPLLKSTLNAALPRSLGLRGSAPRIPTLEAFRIALPKAVYEAIAKHFKTAPAYPPGSPQPEDPEM